MYYVRYSIIYANYNIRWGNKHYLFRRKRTNFYFTFAILFFRSISPASFKRRNGMLVTCMRPWTKKSQFLMPKGSKRSDETIARPLPRWICWFFSKWFSKFFFFNKLIFFDNSVLFSLRSWRNPFAFCSKQEMWVWWRSSCSGSFESWWRIGCRCRILLSRRNIEEWEITNQRRAYLRCHSQSKFTKFARKGRKMADAVSALPFTTEFQIKPSRTGL